jgi:hypothetical protein
VAKAELILEFKDKVTAGLRNVEGQLQSLSKTASSIKFASFVTAAGAVMQIGSQIANALKDYVNAGMEAIQVDSQFEYTLRNVVGATREQIKAAEEYAKVIARKVGLDDDQVKRMMSIAYSLGVQDSQMEKLIQTARGLAMAYGIDVQDAMLKLIKASEGQTEGLRRLGIQIDSHKAKTEGLTYVLQAAGEGFNFVNQYMETGAGKYENLKNTIEDFKEEIGKTILQSAGFKYAMDQLTKAVDSATPVFKFFAQILSLVGIAIGVAADVAKFLFDILVAVGMSLKTVAIAIWDLLHKDFKGAAEELKKGFKEVGDFAIKSGKDFGKGIEDAIKGVIDSFKQLLGLEKEATDPEKPKKKIKSLEELARGVKLTKEQMEQMNLVNNESLEQFKKVAEQLDLTKNLQNEVIQKNNEFFKDLTQNSELFDKVYRKNMEILRERVDVLYHYTTRFVDAMWEGVKAGENLGKVLKDVLVELTEAIVKELIFELIYKAISTAIGYGPGSEASGGILSFFTKLINVPGMQEGGVVDRPTLALIGEREREYVIPESKFPQPVVYVTVHNANPDTYAEVFVHMSKRARRLIYSKLMEA